MSGLVHVYTGNGKGKTTAALGLGIRAYGRGFKVLLVQFLKGADTGELKVLHNLGTAFEVRRSNIKKFVKDMNPEEISKTQQTQRELFEYAVAAGLKGEKDLIILDEIMAAVNLGLLELDAVVKFIKERPGGVEIVLTGRDAPQELIGLADYVSEIHAVKHPLDKGIPARRGIEF
jgi:cob(I)alamin adenosyltransferase